MYEYYINQYRTVLFIGMSEQKAYPISVFIELLLERVQPVLMIHIMPTIRV